MAAAPPGVKREDFTMAEAKVLRRACSAGERMILTADTTDGTDFEEWDPILPSVLSAPSAVFHHKVAKATPGYPPIGASVGVGRPVAHHSASCLTESWETSKLGV
jgi:hypothetical protein